MSLINTKQTRPGMSMTEQVTLAIDVPGRWLLLFLGGKVVIGWQPYHKNIYEYVESH